MQDAPLLIRFGEIEVDLGLQAAVDVFGDLEVEASSFIVTQMRKSS